MKKNDEFQKTSHLSVMADETLKFFEDVSLTVFYEGTLGAGGHAKRILEAHPEIKTYIGCDQDEEALEIARETLKPWKEKVHFVHGNFSDLDLHLKELKIKEADGFFLTSGYRQCSLIETTRGLVFQKKVP